MKPKQLASELQISDVEVLRLAVQSGLVGIGFRAHLLPGQVSSIKKQFAQNFTHQLKPATEQVPESEPVNQPIDVNSAIEQVPESVPQETETGIAEIRQTGLSNAMSAAESQQAHILETEIQQAADDGLRTGVVKELVRATKEKEGAMLVRDAVFRKGQASRDRLNELLKDSAGDDFLTSSQPSLQTYAQTAKVGAATMMDVHQALKNLRVNL